MMVMADFGTAHPGKEFFRPIRPSAVEAVGFFVVDPLHFKAAFSFQFADSSALIIVPLAIRFWMNDRALSSLRNTAGSVLRPRSRMTTTARRLPDLLNLNRRSRRYSVRLAGF